MFIRLIEQIKSIQRKRLTIQEYVIFGMACCLILLSIYYFHKSDKLNNIFSHGFPYNVIVLMGTLAILLYARVWIIKSWMMLGISLTYFVLISLALITYFLLMFPIISIVKNLSRSAETAATSWKSDFNKNEDYHSLG